MTNKQPVPPSLINLLVMLSLLIGYPALLVLGILDDFDVYLVVIIISAIIMTLPMLWKCVKDDEVFIFFVLLLVYFPLLVMSGVMLAPYYIEGIPRFSAFIIDTVAGWIAYACTNLGLNPEITYAVAASTLVVAPLAIIVYQLNVALLDLFGLKKNVNMPFIGMICALCVAVLVGSVINGSILTRALTNETTAVKTICFAVVISLVASCGPLPFAIFKKRR